VEAFPMGVYYFLCRIVIFYNDFGESQLGDDNKWWPYTLPGEGRRAWSEA
jgi:hypothetical protein